MVDSTLPLPLSVNTNEAATNTAAIQTAIDAAHANYIANNGVTTVWLPAGEFPLAASTSSEVFWNYGVTTGAANYCILMRDGVHLLGDGEGRTVLTPSDTSLTCIAVIGGTYQEIDGIEINGGGTSGVGNGLIVLSATNTPLAEVSTLSIRNVFVHDVGGYGFGLQNGLYTNCCLEDIHTLRTGADGIDIKQRPFPANTSNGITLRRIYVEAFGLKASLPAQAGIDIRGICHLEDITVIASGSPVDPECIRFRVPGADEGSGEKGTLTGFYVNGGSVTNCSAVSVGCPDVQITGGYVTGCTYGVSLATSDCARCTVSSVNVSGATQGFFLGSGVTYPNMIGCTALNCTTGFYVRSTNTILMGHRGPGCTTVLDADATATASLAEVGNMFGTSFLSLVSSTTGAPKLSTRGSGTDLDLYLETKGAGLIITNASRIALAGSRQLRTGSGSPNGVVVGSVGDLFLRSDGGAATTLYIKESGAATNTGWVGK
jgi:hypothetical protein